MGDFFSDYRFHKKVNLCSFLQNFPSEYLFQVSSIWSSPLWHEKHNHTLLLRVFLFNYAGEGKGRENTSLLSGPAACFLSWIGLTLYGMGGGGVESTPLGGFSSTVPKRLALES